VQAVLGEASAALSSVSIIEPTHGVYRAKADADRERNAFCGGLCRDMIVHPVLLEIAQLAGRIEGEQAAKGIAIAFGGLVIGAIALHLGFDVATLNVRPFQLIPSLKMVTL
jgi:predicted nucleic acid-binding protein